MLHDAVPNVNELFTISNKPVTQTAKDSIRKPVLEKHHYPQH
jgi:hypothetical protein